jgi:flagellar biosynthetic protein FlhB
MPAGERTEQATPHKRQEARKKGQVAKSIELNAAKVCWLVYWAYVSSGTGSLISGTT